MKDILLIISIFYGPVVLLAGISLFWAKRSQSYNARLWLRRSAYFWLIALATVLGFALLAGATCHGNAVYGYADCALLPSQIADLSVILVIFMYLAAILYTILLFLGAAFLEFKARSNT